MKDDPEIALRRTIKDLIEAGESLAEEINRVAVYWPERTSTPPRVLMDKLEQWVEVSGRASNPE